MLYQPVKLLSHKQCRQIIKSAQRGGMSPGWTVRGTSSMRTNSVHWYTDAGDRLVNEIRNHMVSTAELPVHWIKRPYQITRYCEGELYDWHRDWIPQWQSRSSNRSLTMVCTLQSAPGAVLELEDHTFDLEPGWAVTFPARDLHRATAPTEGERWSMTVWGMQRNTK